MECKLTAKMPYKGNKHSHSTYRHRTYKGVGLNSVLKVTRSWDC